MTFIGWFLAVVVFLVAGGASAYYLARWVVNRRATPPDVTMDDLADRHVIMSTTDPDEVAWLAAMFPTLPDDPDDVEGDPFWRADSDVARMTFTDRERVLADARESMGLPPLDDPITEAVNALPRDTERSTQP